MASELAVASNGSFENGGVQVWSDEPDSYFSDVPDFLIGQAFFKTLHIIDENTLLNVTIYQPSTVFIAPDTSSNNTSDWEKALAEAEWSKQEGMMVGTSLRELNSVQRKDFESNDITLINLPQLNFEFKGVIFITG